MENTVILNDKLSGKISGRLLKIATIEHDWNNDVEDPETIIKTLKEQKIKADIFTFMQRLPETEPKFKYYMEWDNVAAIPLTDYEHWWKKQVTQEARNKTRKAEKKGIKVREVKFSDDLVRGIANIYNETPIKQGKPFKHYNKDFETLKNMHATFLEQSYFIAAYYGEELAGFIKIVNAKRFIRTFHVISEDKHRDKAPNNAMLAKAVEICCREKAPYLVYGQFEYGKKGADSFSDFKKDNGFEKIELPRYYIPLTLKGKILLKLKLHRGAQQLLPRKLITLFLDVRKKWYENKYKT